MSIVLIDIEHDSAGHRWTLWSKGNYQYEVENRKTGYKVPIDASQYEDSLETARMIFRKYVAG